jgi:hypothetical protein
LCALFSISFCYSSFCCSFFVVCRHNTIDTSSCVLILTCAIRNVLLVQNFVKMYLLYTNLNTRKHE